MAFGKQVLGAKSLNEVVDLQNTFTKSAFDAFVAESTKISELSVTTASEAIEPIKARVDEAVQTMSRPPTARPHTPAAALPRSSPVLALSTPPHARPTLPPGLFRLPTQQPPRIHVSVGKGQV